MKQMVQITHYYVLEDYLNIGNNRFLAVDTDGSHYFDDITEAKRFSSIQEADEYAKDVEIFQRVYPTKVTVFVS